MLTFYLITTPIALYFAYLLAFKMYQKKGWEPESAWHREVEAPIAYIIFFAFMLIPIANIIGAIVLVCVTMSEPKETKIDAWLFRKPKQPDEKEE